MDKLSIDATNAINKGLRKQYTKMTRLWSMRIGKGGQKMANEKLISELRKIASLTPPICTKDKPEDVVMFGNTITIYCKPFEQFQELIARAADALEVDAVPVVHGRWLSVEDSLFPGTKEKCSLCGVHKGIGYVYHYCPNCGAKMDGGNEDG